MIKIYHNPRCSKSRQTLALLEAQQVDHSVIEYLKTPPGKSELKDILKKLNKEPLEIMRKKEKIMDKLNIDLTSKSDVELIDLIIKHPILLERPIVVTDEDARIGRPPESVLELF
ncbi:MAG: arsenate reductase (glutaredoxin) [Gammaproteobacteria bacterium]|nr:arsenate reductase (glutaredoxin) [Gammaproteobacteria bacterium]NNC96739.1 arsenate reductase (glutaredoxin) [Gammaproteobacteria bacterium]NNM13977.1 arsenate reductase (glutaredoxin) [Gammaproteobacteria bacterium]